MILRDICTQLLVHPKGLLAADESTTTANKRFAAVGIPETIENRGEFRELLFTTPSIESYISGVILFDETIRQTTAKGVLLRDTLLKKNILVGIKVDEGVEPLFEGSAEVVTKGIAGLAQRLPEYKGMGATFAKWRAVIRIGAGMPSDRCLEENAQRLAAYVKMCQGFDLVPIIEPEVLFEGTHTLVESQEVLTRTLGVVFKALQEEEVLLDAVILKSSMALPGSESGTALIPEDIAKATLAAFHASVPHEIPGIVFLSGGQSPDEAVRNLNAISKQGQQPWDITFSFSRALQDPVLKAWSGEDTEKEQAQALFAERLQLASLAREGTYSD